MDTLHACLVRLTPGLANYYAAERAFILMHDTWHNNPGLTRKQICRARREIEMVNLDLGLMRDMVASKNVMLILKK